MGDKDDSKENETEGGHCDDLSRQGMWEIQEY